MHYTGTIWRPPYEAESLLLEATAGCTHHQCKFCTLYADLPFPFRMSALENIESDLQESQIWSTDPIARLTARLQGSSGQTRIRRVFLAGANPFVLSSQRLMAIAGLIHKYLPSVEAIGSFARITDITPKSDEELSALRQAGYDGQTIGIETGDAEALSFMNKGYTPADILEQCCRLDQAGIRYSFFYLAGISGAGAGKAGARDTGRLCNQLHPLRIGVNMLTVYPESELYQEIRQGRWQESSELEKYQEIRELVKTLDIPVWFAALGASNPIQLQGNLPDDRDALLTALDRILADTSEETLLAYRRSLPHL